MNVKKEVALSVVMLVLVVTGMGVVLAVNQKVTVTVLPGEVNISSPAQDAIYNQRSVPINVSLSFDADFLRYQDGDGRVRNLCRNCDEYGVDRLRRKSFKDGFHTLKIIAEFDGVEIFNYINFTVDSKNPNIIKTLPRRGFTKGDFNVQFREANPVSVFLNYGNSAVGFREKIVNFDNCVEARSGTLDCSVWVNLTDYDGGEIDYSFNITDIIGNVDISRMRTINVDTAEPVLNNPVSFWVQGVDRKSKYIYFDFNVTEKNFDEISYTYIDSRGRERERKLCSRLKNSICEKKRSFRKGEHNITINIKDDAGNTIQEEIDFEIL